MSLHEEKPPMVESEKCYAKIHLSLLPKVIINAPGLWEGSINLGVFTNIC